MPATHRGAAPARYKRARLDGDEHARPGPSRHTTRSRGEDQDDDDDDLNLLPSSDAFQDAAAARAADPLGLNEALWEKGWEGGKLHHFSGAPSYAAAPIVDEPASPHPSDEAGASDFSDEEEKAAYISVRRASRIERQGQERRRELEERRLARIKALEAADAGDGAEASSSNGSPSKREPVPLSKATFNLMVKTAAAVRASTKPKQLELRILTHHGGDERFAFLRRDGGKANEIWERLKAGESLNWKDIDESEEAESRRKIGGQSTGLLTGYDSDSESDGEEEGGLAVAKGEEAKEAEKDEADVARRQEEEAAIITAVTATSNDLDTGQKAKDRIARARQWAAEQRAAKEAASATQTKASQT